MTSAGDAPDAPIYRVRVAELPVDERPRERLLRLGPQALTSSELLAILLRTGTTREGVLEIATRCSPRGADCAASRRPT